MLVTACDDLSRQTLGCVMAIIHVIPMCGYQTACEDTDLCQSMQRSLQEKLAWTVCSVCLSVRPSFKFALMPATQQAMPRS